MEGLGNIKVRKRVKPCSVFLVTLEVSDVYDTVREDFLEAFDSVLTYCVAIEKSCNSSRVSYHLHAFLEFKDKIFLSDLNHYIRSVWPDTHFDLQSCKSRRNVLKYITKEDIHCIFNCKISELNFNYRIFHWASNCDVFRHNDPFVVEHRFCYNYLSKYFFDLKRENITPFVGFRSILTVNKGWALDCALWWNSVIDNFKVRRKCLYLYGDTGVGKSSLIENFIGEENMGYVFYPGVGKFFMQGFKSHFHKCILFEEFDATFYPFNYLKRLLEGRMYSYPVKCSNELQFVFKGPIIFISNFFNITDEALLSRLIVVRAENPFWHYVELPLSEDSQGLPEVSQGSGTSECEYHSRKEKEASRRIAFKEKIFQT